LIEDKEDQINILFVYPTMPYPETDGGKIRVMNLMRRLCRIHKVTLLAFTDSPADEQGVEYLRETGIDVIGVRRVRPKLAMALHSLLRNFIRGKPLTVSKYYSVEMAKALENILRTRRIDIIHFEMLHTGQFLPNLRTQNVEGQEGDPGLDPESGFMRYSTVLGEQNIDSSIWFRLAKSEPNPLKKLIFYSQHRSFANYESLICTRFDMCICVSSEDQRRLSSLCPGATIEIVPNGVDLDYFSPGEVEEDDTCLVFTGSMDWQPNEDAVSYFCDYILPIIRESLPEVRFYIVGSNPTDRVLKLSRQKGVIVTGSVEDVRPYIARAAVYVVPLRVGGGTRLKILQALAMKKAVVSTAVGCEGLDLQPDEHLFVADEPRQFAAKTIQLIKDPLLRCRLGENGRNLLREKFDWDVIVKGLELEYRKLISGAPVLIS
jgi:glycosyltransferase involved in cell wall biosynthesis